MATLFDLLFKKPHVKCEIKVQIDDKKEKCITTVDGNLPSVLTGLSLLVSKLMENDIPKELIRGAIDIGLEEKNKKVIEKEIIIDNEEKAKKIEKFLEDLEDK